MRSTRSSRTAPATAGCSRTAWPMCWRATTRRCRRWTSSSRTWAWCWTWRAPASSRCRCRPPRTRCSCRPPAPATGARTTAPSSRSSRASNCPNLLPGSKSMNILITGGCGFLGARLARTLLARGQLALDGGAEQAISRIVLADRAPPPADLAADARIQFLGGDLLDQLQAGALPLADSALVVHLAAGVSGECEADFDLGMRSNLDATRALLEG